MPFGHPASKPSDMCISVSRELIVALTVRKLWNALIGFKKTKTDPRLLGITRHPSFIELIVYEHLPLGIREYGIQPT